MYNEFLCSKYFSTYLGFVSSLVRNINCLKRNRVGPGWTAQLVTVSNLYTKVAGLMPSQGTYEDQPMNASISGTTN